MHELWKKKRILNYLNTLLIPIQRLYRCWWRIWDQMCLWKLYDVGNNFLNSKSKMNRFQNSIMNIYDRKQLFFMKLIVVKELQTITNCRFDCLFFRNVSFFMQFHYCEIESVSICKNWEKTEIAITVKNLKNILFYFLLFINVFSK